MCFLSLLGACMAKQTEDHEHLKVSSRHSSEGRGHSFVKRDIDNNEGYDSSYENFFEGPHRIRVLPGFLH